MSPITTRLFLLVFVAFRFPVILCECKQSYVTICDSFKDLETYKDIDNMEELIIGSGKTKPTSVNLVKALKLYRFRKVTTIIVNQTINQLEKKFRSQCTYLESSLQYLIFYGNEFKSIGPYHIPEVPLKKLGLVNNKIETIELNAFDLHSIEKLDLSDNLMEEVLSNTLPEVSTKTITIRNNKLVHIEPKSFPEKLQCLNLDGNQLRTFQSEVLDLPNLQEFTLSHNKINEIPDVSHLKELVIFDISHNKIVDVKSGTFNHMTKLKLLDLSHNNIYVISILQRLHAPGKQPTLTISLAFNRLTELNMTNVDLEKKSLVLYGNSWVCQVWTPLKKLLIGHESQCDLEFLSSGKVPYCYEFTVEDYVANLERLERDQQQFQAVVKNSADFSMCELKLDRNQWLYPVEFGCIW